MLNAAGALLKWASEEDSMCLQAVAIASVLGDNTHHTALQASSYGP